jgi:hypothetical protein
VLYFNVSSAVLQGEQSKGLAQLVATMTTTPRVQAIISGYHSASGELAANQELAKQRAFTVRDALLAAGVPAARVVLSKPLQAEANLQGEDPAARRVEVTSSSSKRLAPWPPQWPWRGLHWGHEAMTLNHPWRRCGWSRRRLLVWAHRLRLRPHPPVPRRPHL